MDWARCVSLVFDFVGFSSTPLHGQFVHYFCDFLLLLLLFSCCCHSHRTTDTFTQPNVSFGTHRCTATIFCYYCWYFVRVLFNSILESRLVFSFILFFVRIFTKKRCAVSSEIVEEVAKRIDLIVRDLNWTEKYTVRRSFVRLDSITGHFHDDTKMIGSDYVLEAHNIYHTAEVRISKIKIFCEIAILIECLFAFRWTVADAWMATEIRLWFWKVSIWRCTVAR